MGPGPAAPIAHQVALRARLAGPQGSTRSSSTTLRRFKDRSSDGRLTGTSVAGIGPASLGLTMADTMAESRVSQASAAEDAAAPARSRAAPRPRPDPQARRMASQDPRRRPRPHH
ncbi:hypothetical protein PHMEG_00027557 [Phytophthora megakarya]|uniref:Uncharacterized protein n=1 Tax=Phytophthora megakarya TaxID=4795 RepID=A0A225V6M9_9STRA|nr:hypothetical protein PHMEG_00027557 [Phytophthora megakarya]